jgi:hypothetical protein
MVFNQQHLLPHIGYVNNLPTISNAINSNNTAESLTIQLKDSKIRHGTHDMYDSNIFDVESSIIGTFIETPNITHDFKILFNDVRVRIIEPYKAYETHINNLTQKFKQASLTGGDFSKIIDEINKQVAITDGIAKHIMTEGKFIISDKNKTTTDKTKINNLIKNDKDKIVSHIKTSFKHGLMGIFQTSRKDAKQNNKYFSINYFTFTDNVMNVDYEGNKYTTKLRQGKTTYVSRHYLLGAKNISNLADHLSNYNKIHCFVCLTFFKLKEYSLVKFLIPVYKTDKTNEIGQEFLKLIEKTGGTKENVVNFSKFVEYNTPYIKYQPDKPGFKETNFILTSSKIHVNKDNLHWSESMLNADAPQDNVLPSTQFLKYNGLVRHEDPSSSCQRISEIGSILFTQDLTKATSGLGFTNQINALNKSPLGQLLLGVMLLLILYTLFTVAIFVLNNDVSRAFGRMLASPFEAIYNSFHRLEKMNSAK